MSTTYILAIVATLIALGIVVRWLAFRLIDRLTVHEWQAARHDEAGHAEKLAGGFAPGTLTALHRATDIVASAHVTNSVRLLHLRPVAVVAIAAVAIIGALGASNILDPNASGFLREAVAKLFRLH